MQNEHPPTNRRRRSPLKILSYAGIAVGALVVLCVLVLLIFSDPLVNRFIKPRVTKAIAEAYPEYSLRIADMKYSIFQDRFGFDSVALSAANGAFSGTAGRFSVSGIGWMHLLWGGSLATHDFRSAVVDAKDVVLAFPQEHYELRCELLRVSVPDSQLVADALKLHPTGDDEQFFAGSKFRQTRFRLVVPHTRIVGLACLGLMEGMYCSRSARLHDPFLDVLINKDKKFAVDSSSPPMPNEILASIRGTLQVDSLCIVNGSLKYGERFGIRAKPALITLDSMHVVALGMNNHGGPGAAMVAHAEGKFMNAGAMTLRMSIPVASREFSYQYSGSLGKMDLQPINGFIETAEQMRIKTGNLHVATFEISVASGRASGNVRAIYDDLSLAAISKQTGSEKGFSDVFASFIARNFRIRGTNVPDKSGSMKIGQVKYARKGDEYFLEYSWFALRSGVGDVVGF